ncbi:AAA family ATPase [Streptomyces sp. Wb2n-11]|uniref:ATP-binding protein n=1 Tax=Streptomyces sp. Wb2n-11 TaxID=1030533 RepID=UPI000B300448|nr:AAA family ATPase [Streptomyces sp. Wb2n-11]
MRRTPRSFPQAPAHGNLPAELNPFVGRREELAELGRLLEDTRLITVTGIGGVGKTRFALHAANDLQERYCDGAWLAELSALADPGLLEHAVVEALGLTDQTSKPPRSVLVEHLAERRLLLVLDGFEHLVDATAGLVRELLRRAPGLTVLAAGRLPLCVDGEQTFPLPPMPGPDAVRLFTVRAAAGQPGFRLTDANRDTVHELCRRLDGLPLALELAAGRLKALSVEQLLDRLDDRFRLLTGSTRGTLPRHQTLRTAIGWSHELCTPEQRLLWARLSVFAGQFDLEAAEYVCGGPELPGDSTLSALGVLDVLTDLITQSVVVREDTASGVRYRMLDTVREYGADWLVAMGDAERVCRRHRDWYLGLATWCELEWFSPRQAEVAARVDSELPNLRRAMEYSLEHPQDVHLGQYLAGTLWFYWAGCGRLSEGRHWLDHALEAESRHEPHRLKALWVLGYVAVLQGDAIGALAALQECREGAELSANPVAAAYAVHRSGCLALVSDDMRRAEELLRDALSRYEEIGELNSNVLMAQVELAMAVAFRGDLAQAVAICEEVATVCEDHGERWALAYALYVLAYAAHTHGRPDRARELLAECLAINHTFNDLLGVVLALELLALVTLDEGDPAEAAVLQGAAGRIWPSVGLPLFGSAYYNMPHALCEEKARERLGDGPYEKFRCQGASLGLDAVVARALEGPTRPAPAVPPRPRGASVPGISAPHTREPAVSRSVRNEEAAG